MSLRVWNNDGASVASEVERRAGDREPAAAATVHRRGGFAL